VKARLAAALFLICTAAPARAQAGLEAAVTEETISVTSDFRGARVTVFGAMPDRRGRGDIVIAVRGPREATTVLQRRRVFGLWLAGAPVRFASAPSYSMLASNRPLKEITDSATRQRLALDLASDTRIDETPSVGDPAQYRLALARLKRAQGLYVETPNLVKRLPGGLFKATIALPSNAPVGAYTSDVYYFRNGRLIDTERTAIVVSTAGVERFMRDMADRRPILYGLATIILALVSGWGASYLFRRT
jgi:uncharacterized protein (TIGR02186 family)